MRWVVEYKMYNVYILQSIKNGKHYIGYTADISRRIRYHNTGRNISTKTGMPWKVIYLETYQDKKTAWLRERQIKSYKGGEGFKKLLQNKGDVSEWSNVPLC